MRRLFPEARAPGKGVKVIPKLTGYVMLRKAKDLKRISARDLERRRGRF